VKTSKTPDGQISVDLWVPKTQRGQNIVTAICLALVVATPIVVVLFYQMNQIGMPVSSLLWRSSPEQAVASAPPAEPTPAPEPTPQAPSLDQSAALEAYKAGLYALDGMESIVSDIHTGYQDGQVELVVTPTFENQPKATRESVAQDLWRAWVISTESQLDPSRASIRLVNSRGKSVGGSGVLKGVYVDD
jgi:hypothetical protein